MHTTEQRILNKFKREPHREISTTELVREAHLEEYAKILPDLESDERQKSSKAKIAKGQLHRNTLYHINNLVKERILKISSVKGRGEKYYSLMIDEGELVISKRHRQIVISKQAVSTSLIEEYEKKGIVHKFDPENWVNKLGCIILECRNEGGMSSFYSQVYNCFSEVNDCIGLYGFERMIERNSIENNEDVLRKMDLDTRDHDRMLTLIISLKAIRDEEKMASFLGSYARMRPKNVNIIFKGDSKDLKERQELFRKVASHFLKEEIKINFQNTSSHEAPFVIGKAGPYTVRNDEWKDYEKDCLGKTIGLAVASMSIAIDVSRLYSESPTTKDVRELFLKVAKTLLRVSTSQTRRSSEYFKRLNDLNKHHTKRFFAHQKSYIRLWNYDLKDKRQENLPGLLASCQAELKDFCRTERMIYNACGLPIGFDAVLSSVFNKFSSQLSTRNYLKTTIRRSGELDTPEIREFIMQKEQLSKVFEGGDRTRFFRKGDYRPEDLVREIAYLMSTTSLPLITYDFKETKGETKLTSFMEG
ncbi:hypothetical protein JW826_02600 [Candidatus Woesearchaeota archaeon]|nr:hypothetical protein [Candidatus Woesearchaeota archaeon]